MGGGNEHCGVLLLIIVHPAIVVLLLIFTKQFKGERCRE